MPVWFGLVEIIKPYAAAELEPNDAARDCDSPRGSIELSNF
jgi:hypothetical protein